MFTEGGKATRHNVWVNAKHNFISFKFNKKPNLVNANADGVLLAEIKENKTAEEYLHQYIHSKDLKSRLLLVHFSFAQENYSPTTLKILLAGLKDPYHKMRIQAISLWIYLNLKYIKIRSSTTGKKMAKTDPKTLVQAKVIGALATLGIKNILLKMSLNPFLSLYRKFRIWNCKIPPEKRKELLNDIDLENANEDLVMLLLPTIVEKIKCKNICLQLPQWFAFYPFIAFQKPELAKLAEAGFNWIMDSDDTKSVFKSYKKFFVK